jgi:hypothetical protein
MSLPFTAPCWQDYGTCSFIPGMENCVGCFITGHDASADAMLAKRDATSANLCP